MSEEIKLTKKQRAALEWFGRNDGVRQFSLADPETPSSNMRHAVVKNGWVEARSNGFMQFMSHHLTAAGHAAISSHKDKPHDQ